MIYAILQDALQNGTRKWDVTISRSLSILLLSSLRCRVGDIAKGEFDDHSLPFLCWRDIRLKLVGGSEPKDLRGITIRNKKGHKYVQLTFLGLVLKPLLTAVPLEMIQNTTERCHLLYRLTS